MAGFDGPYHKHLDICRRCANNPFNLCPVGARALEEEAKASLTKATDNMMTAAGVRLSPGRDGRNGT